MINSTSSFREEKLHEFGEERVNEKHGIIYVNSWDKVTDHF